MIEVPPPQIAKEKFFDFRDFADLDSSKDADFLISSMAEMHALDTIRKIKKVAIDLLDVKRGDRVLEVGCGLGFDAQTLAKRVGIQGEVVAIDCSQRMLAAAKLNSNQPNIYYQLGNAQQLNEIILNKHIGRELPVLFKQFNLTNIQVIPQVYMIRDFNLVNTMINFPRIIQDLVKLKIYTLEQANTVLTDLQNADANGEFLYSITLFTVAANR